MLQLKRSWDKVENVLFLLQSNFSFFFFLYKFNGKIKKTEYNLIYKVFTEVFLIFKKTLWPLFMDGVQLSRGYSHFEEAVYFLPFSSQKLLYSFYQPRKDDRLSRPWSHPVVLNTGSLDWESSTLTNRPLLHARIPHSTVVITEADIQRCSIKKVFLKISQNSQENTCTRASFLINLQALQNF